MRTSWRQVADQTIEKAYEEVLQRDGMTPAEAMKIVNKEFYPFGPRAHFPYKAWLAAIKSKKIRLGLMRPPSYKDSPKYLPHLESE